MGGALRRCHVVDMAASVPQTKRAAKPRKLTRAEAAALYARLAGDRPAPRTELVYSNPYTLLVAVVLSA